MSDDDETNSDAVVDAQPPAAEEPAPTAEPTAEPFVLLHAVMARDAAAPRRRARGTLSGVSLALGSGVFAFVGGPEDGTFALFDVITGTRAPLRGRVAIAGASPARSGATRARIGMLPPEPLLPPSRTVAEAVSIAQHARGEAQARPTEVLASLGLESLAPRSPTSLSFAESRAVELAIALSTPSPLLVALHEPLADVAVNLLGVVRERIRQLAAAGTCVVITTSSPADARALGDSVIVLHRGAIAGGTSSADVLPGGTPLLVAWVRPAEQHDGLAPIRLLARVLAERPEVSSVAWNDKQDASAQAAELRLSGSDIDACALALADAATEVGAVIEAIAPASPGLTRLRAASETTEALRRATPPHRPATSNAPLAGGSR
ncbi:MAG: ATP-binding cassette domain-containing protein [Polyangiaceae bacterium]|nr:ATP-binding cassette domain-containing protein [Polyangiaceae bacterium]